MDNITKSVMLTEYYETVSDMLGFRPNEETQALEESILRLIFDIFGCTDDNGEIRAAIESAQGLTTLSDVLLLTDDEITPALAVKIDILQKLKIQHLRAFDSAMFFIEIEDSALSGNKLSCKLFAALKWLGLVTEQDRKTALEIWKMLGVNGDEEAMLAVVYACDKLGETEERDKWKAAYVYLNDAERKFSPMVFSDDDNSGVQLANLILASKNKIKKSDTSINRALAQYILYSGDSFTEKLGMVSEDLNFYTVLWKSHQNNGKIKKTGF